MDDRLDAVFGILGEKRCMIGVCLYYAEEGNTDKVLSTRLRELMGPFGSGGSRKTRKR